MTLPANWAYHDTFTHNNQNDVENAVNANTNALSGLGSITATGDSYSETIGNASDTVFPIVHNLDTLDVFVAVWRVSSGEEV